MIDIQNVHVQFNYSITAITGWRVHPMVQPFPPKIYWVTRFYINNFDDLCNAEKLLQCMQCNDDLLVVVEKVARDQLIKVGVFKLTGLPCPSSRTCFQVSSKGLVSHC